MQGVDEGGTWQTRNEACIYELVIISYMHSGSQHQTESSPFQDTVGGRNTRATCIL